MASMAMDLDKKEYNKSSYEEYILGSAEVVGLMCLKVFLNGDNEKYEEEKPKENLSISKSMYSPKLSETSRELSS